MTPAGGQPVDWSQWSVILLKPDCIERRLTSEILDWIGRVVLVSAVRTVRVTEGQIFAHYADLFPRAEEIGVDIAAGLRRIYVGRDVVIALGHGPHRALWDALGAALLLAALIDALPDGDKLTYADLVRIAGHPGNADHKNPAQAQPQQTSLPGI